MEGKKRKTWGKEELWWMEYLYGREIDEIVSNMTILGKYFPAVQTDTNWLKWHIQEQLKLMDDDLIYQPREDYYLWNRDDLIALGLLKSVKMPTPWISEILKRTENSVRWKWSKCRGQIMEIPLPEAFSDFAKLRQKQIRETIQNMREEVTEKRLGNDEDVVQGEAVYTKELKLENQRLKSEVEAYKSAFSEILQILIHTGAFNTKIDLINIMQGELE
jgi:hypothetical protein